MNILPWAIVTFYVLFFGLAIAAFVYWVIALVEVARIPEYQFRVVGTEKTTWILVVALLQGIGALIWLFAKRREVLAAAGRLPHAPPGWYPDPYTGAMRWWDGYQWVGQAPPPPSPLGPGR